MITYMGLPSESLTMILVPMSFMNISILCSENDEERFVQHPSSRILQRGSWLCDSDMDLAVNLIKHQWPDVVSQAPCYIQRPSGFNCALPKKYVQVGYNFVALYTLIDFVIQSSITDRLLPSCL